jgi:uncharacterized membrane protein YebE (DUF533 family)
MPGMPGERPIVNTTLLLTVLNGALSGRRKRSSRARSFLAGRGGLLSKPAVWLTGCGLAWGVYETLRRMRTPAAPPGAADTTPAAAGTDVVPAATALETSAPLPPLLPDGADVDPAGLRLISLALSAAHADGTVSDRERAAIGQQATASGLPEALVLSVTAPQPLASIVEGVTSAEEAATLYVLAYTIVRADEQVTPTERIYLAQLAHLLRLDPATVEALERDTGARIDALGDQGQLGG